MARFSKKNIYKTQNKSLKFSRSMKKMGDNDVETAFYNGLLKERYKGG